MQKLHLLYLGTPDFSARLLEKIILDKELPLEVAGVVTQADKLVGKKKILTPSPVKETAKKYGLQVFETVPPDTSHVFDIALLYAYGKIIPADSLTAARYGFWNIHPSLLPCFRGPSPMVYPLILGEERTGVTLMKMDQEIDHGPIIDQVTYSVQPSERRSHLEEKLSDLGYELFKKNIQTLSEGTRETVQDHSKATFTRLIRRDDGYVSLATLVKSMGGETLAYEELPAIIREYLEKYSHGSNRHGHHLNYAVFHLFRGLFPWPGIWTKVFIDGTEKRLKIIDLHMEKDRLILDRVQLEGKNEVDFTTFNRAYLIFPGAQ